MAMLSNQIHRWLVWLADPANDQLTSPPDPVDPPGLERLLSLGSLHTVLPTVVRNLRNLSQRCGPDSVVLTRRDGSQSRGVLDRALQSVEGELRMRTAFSLILRQQAGEITIALGDEGIGVTVIKGEEFADRLYPSASLRGFTDVDMLVGEESRDQTFGVMAELGYRSRDTRMKYDTGYGEMGFVRDGHPGGTVEIHWNLVNSPTLRRGISVEYEDLQFDSACKLTPASLLLIAAVHGAASHGFDRLQLLCDVCQAARGAAALDPDHGPAGEADFIERDARVHGVVSGNCYLLEAFVGTAVSPHGQPNTHNCQHEQPSGDSTEQSVLFRRPAWIPDRPAADQMWWLLLLRASFGPRLSIFAGQLNDISVLLEVEAGYAHLLAELSTFADGHPLG